MLALHCTPVIFKQTETLQLLAFSLCSPLLFSIAVNLKSMEVDPENNNKGDRPCSSLRIKISELERNLTEEKDRYVMSQSQLEFAKLFASQEVDKYRRECVSLRETVARLNEDCKTMRERELRDQKSIKGLLEEIEMKDREFAEKFVELKVEIRDLERGKKRTQNEVDEWKKKCADCEDQLSELVNETAVEFEKKENEHKEKFVVLAEQNSDLEHKVLVWMKRYEEALQLLEENCRPKGKETAEAENKELEDRILKLAEENSHLVGNEKGDKNAKGKDQSLERGRGNIASEVDDELPKRTQDSVKKSSGEDLLSSGDLGRKRVLVMVDDSESEGERGGHASDVEEDQITLSQRIKKKPTEVIEGDQKDSGSSLNHSSGIMEPSRECFASLQPSRIGSTGVKETYVEVTDGRMPPTQVSKLNPQEVSKGTFWKI